MKYDFKNKSSSNSNQKTTRDKNDLKTNSKNRKNLLENNKTIKNNKHLCPPGSESPNSTPERTVSFKDRPTNAKKRPASVPNNQSVYLQTSDKSSSPPSQAGPKRPQSAQARVDWTTVIAAARAMNNVNGNRGTGTLPRQQFNDDNQYDKSALMCLSPNCFLRKACLSLVEWR